MVGTLHTELRLTYQRVSSFFIPRKEEVGRSHCSFLTLGSFIEEPFPLQLLFAKDSTEIYILNLLLWSRTVASKRR